MPAMTKRPFGSTASAAAEALPGSGVVTIPPRPKERSGRPSGRYSAAANSALGPAPCTVPARRILPSGRTDTAAAVAVASE